MSSRIGVWRLTVQPLTRHAPPTIVIAMAMPLAQDLVLSLSLSGSVSGSGYGSALFIYDLVCVVFVGCVCCIVCLAFCGLDAFSSCCFC